MSLSTFPEVAQGYIIKQICQAFSAINLATASFIAGYSSQTNSEYREVFLIPVRLAVRA